MALTRPTDTIGGPRIISAALGGQFEDEAAFMEGMTNIAALLQPGLMVLGVFDDGSALLYVRTSVPVPEDEDDEPEGPYLRLHKTIVTSEGTDYFNSIVMVGTMILGEGGVRTSWARAVGIGDPQADPVTFGLNEMSLTDD